MRVTSESSKHVEKFTPLQRVQHPDFVAKNGFQMSRGARRVAKPLPKDHRDPPNRRGRGTIELQVRPYPLSALPPSCFSPDLPIRPAHPKGGSSP